MKQIGGKRIVLYAGILAVILIFVSAITLTYSKYKQPPATKDGVVSAKSFYFASDILKDESENKTYDIYDWDSGIEIKFMNYADAMQVAGSDVSYTITVPQNCTVSDSNNQLVTGEQTLAGGDKKSKSVWIKMDNPITTETPITVTATSKPYAKKLEATFNLHPVKPASYKIVDSLNSPTASLYLTGDAHGHTITLVYDSNDVFPDATNPALKEGEVTLKAKESGMILLFKTNPENDDFSSMDTDIVNDIVIIK